MTAFEHRLVRIDASRDTDRAAAERLLDGLGADGWEAVGLMPQTASSRGLHVETGAYVVLLKRARAGGA